MRPHEENIFPSLGSKKSNGISISLVRRIPALNTTHHQGRYIGGVFDGVFSESLEFFLVLLWICVNFASESYRYGNVIERRLYDSIH